MRRAVSLVAIAALAIAGALALVSAGFVTIHLLDPRYPSDARISSWVYEGLGWVEAAVPSDSPPYGCERGPRTRGSPPAWVRS